jgi:hypothetical protein
MINFEFPNGSSRLISSYAQLLLTFDGMLRTDWESGSGMGRLVSESTKSYISLIKHPMNEVYMLISARKLGDDEYVHSPTDQYTATIEIYVGGDLTNYPIEFFSTLGAIKNIFKRFIEDGAIEYDRNWRILHLQEWPGMLK